MLVGFRFVFVSDGRPNETFLELRVVFRSKINIDRQSKRTAKAARTCKRFNDSVWLNFNENNNNTRDYILEYAEAEIFNDIAV